MSTSLLGRHNAVQGMHNLLYPCFVKAMKADAVGRTGKQTVVHANVGYVAIGKLTNYSCVT